jgi:glycosyltransferase involved in cell wall biosynthesis
VKLLVISHACITPANQDLFARVQRLTGWELTLILPRTWKSEYGRRRAELLPGFEAKLRPLPVALSGNIPLHFYLAPLSRVFAEERPDVIYVQHDAHMVGTMQAFRANRRRPGAPIGFKNDQNIPKRYPGPIRIGERFVFRNAAFALTSTRPAAEYLREKGYRGPLRVVPFGVDLSLYRVPDRGRPRKGSLVVGFVGRLVPQKGVDTLLQALAQAPDTVRALIIGSGPSETDLRSLATRLGIADRVEWRGYVEHLAMPEIYAEMDLLVVPSRTTERALEQFGRVVIEALACGVPVCSSDSGEPPTLVAQTGGGWTFREERADELAERLSWADANREELRRRAEMARARVRELFSNDSVAESFAEVVRRYALKQAA